MKMRKLVLTVAVAGAALLGTMTKQAQAQTYPDVSSLTPFTQPANYMSLPGVLRLRYLISSGRWISRPEAVSVVQSQGGTANTSGDGAGPMGGVTTGNGTGAGTDAGAATATQ